DLKLCSGETFRGRTVVHYYVVATEHGSLWVQPQPSDSKAVDAADLDMCSGETLGATMLSLSYFIATMLGCWPVQHQASNFKTAKLELCSGETFRATTVVPYYVVATEHGSRSEEHTSELQSRFDLVCRLLLEKKKNNIYIIWTSIFMHVPLSLLFAPFLFTAPPSS